MSDKNVLFLVHRIYKDGIVKKGGADYIADYLKFKKYEIITIGHPLASTGKSYIRESKSTKEFEIFGKGPIRWIQEVIFNISHIENSKYKSYKLVLAVDPLNFVSAFLIKIFKQRKAVILFHSIDYSENRFGFFIFDYIYNLLYTFAVKKADMVTHVSKIMGEKIKEICKNRQNFNEFLYYLPNSPEYEKIPKIDPALKNKQAIVYSKAFISSSEVELLKKVIEKIVEQYPKIILNVIGNVYDGDKKRINNKNLKKNIKFHGLVPYEENIRIMSNSYIGLGWYENKLSFEKYNDSLKLREYAASGLPAVCNDKTSTAIEMENVGAGKVANNAAEIALAISAFLSNEKIYLDIRKNAMIWAKNMDKAELLKNLMIKLKL